MKPISSVLTEGLAREGIKVEIHGPIYTATAYHPDGSKKIHNSACISQADAEDWLIQNLKIEHPNSPTLRAVTGDTSVEDGRDPT